MRWKVQMIGQAWFTCHVGHTALDILKAIYCIGHCRGFGASTLNPNVPYHQSHASLVNRLIFCNVYLPYFIILAEM